MQEMKIERAIGDKNRNSRFGNATLLIILSFVALTTLSILSISSIKGEGEDMLGHKRQQVKVTSLKGSYSQQDTEEMEQVEDDNIDEEAAYSYGAEDDWVDVEQKASMSMAEISLTQPQCLSFEEEFNALVSSVEQVYIIMPPKASGSSINLFVRRCTNIQDSEFKGDVAKDNSEFLTHRLNLPPIVSTHLKADKAEEMLHDFIGQTTKDSLIIYIHREETDRLMSAIRHIAENRLCTPPGGRWGTPGGFIDAATFSVDEKKCTIDESRMIDAIEGRINEIGTSVHKYLTCNNYDAIEENAPNFVFVDFRHVDQLQAVLAGNYCPDLLSRVPFHANDSADREMKAYIKMGERDVPIKEWVEGKRSLFEWTLKMKEDISCQGKTRKLENTLFACDEGILQVSSAFQKYIHQ